MATPWRRALEWTLAGGACAVPLFFSPTGEEAFRLPKELLFRAEGIITIALLAILWLHRELPAWPFDRRVTALLAAISGWTLVTTLTSTSRLMSIDSAAITIFSIAIFAAVATIPGERRRVFLWAISAAGAANALLFLAQAVLKASPFEVQAEGMALPATGFLGNPNDVGTFLAFVAIAQVAWAIAADRRIDRIAALSMAVLCGGTIFVSRTLTAVLALLAGLWVLAAIAWPRRRVVIVSLLIALAGITAILAWPPLRDKVVGGVIMARQGKINEAASSRVVPALACAEMLRDHPITGVGPGAFRRNYFDYKLVVDSHYHWLMPERRAEWSLGRRISFGEAHNEFAQAAAETGVIGLALMLAAIVLLARKSLHPSNAYGRVLALPLTVTFAVTSLAQFPLRLAAPRLVLVTLAALCFTRSDGE